uniref:ATP synthase subunit a n=1 Tax=Lepidoblepharon ophthalmolepis TaxID=195621 RepID=A0A090AMV0_9PLEU|nr:ATP synthase F0 subunit 6 [Lepidoblepharon ophthalmolepis]BAP58969.1 ATPase subunit 6 [Lepidoblepharon ophthalmolepis]
MVTSFFHQFESPVYLGLPLIALALAFPCLLLPLLSPRVISNRTATLQSWTSIKLTQQLLLPLKKGGRKWASLIISLLFFLTLLNLLGLLPYTFSPTSQLSLNLGLAVPLWLATVIIGFWNQPNHALAHLLPEGTPTLLVPMLIIIETISLFIRPLALGVRLTANITAGHLLIQLVSTAIFVLIPLMPAVAILTAALLLLLIFLEIAVAMIQAYVFTLLLTLYLEENL